MSRNFGGSIEDRGSSYRVEIWVDAERHRFSLKKKAFTKREAQKWAVEKHMELEEEASKKAAARSGAIHVSTLIDLFRERHVSTLAPNSQKPYGALFNGLNEYFVRGQGDPKVSDIGSRAVKEYLHWRRTNSQREDLAALSERSVNKERTNFRKMMEWAIEMEYIDSNPVARVGRLAYDRPDPTFISDVEYEALLSVTEPNPMLHTFCLVLGEAGLRCESEALWLRWEDVKFDDPVNGPHLEVVSGRHLDRKGRTHQTKTKRSRYVPLSPRLAKALRQHSLRYRGAIYGKETSPWLFHHEITRRQAKAGDRIGSLRHSFESACKKAELSAGFTMHDLRHRRCTLWLSEGIPIYSVKEAMGHSSVTTTEWYTHFVKQHLAHFRSGELEEKGAQVGS